MNAPNVPQMPLLELDLLKTLVAIVETGNFSAAAEVVFRTPSAVSMQVKRIEELLGRAIFARDSRSVSLTPEGELLLSHARRMLALNRDVISQFITPDVAGVVRLGAPDDAAERFLPEMLRRFTESHCCVTVDVVVEPSVELVRKVRQKQLDLAIFTAEADYNGTVASEVVFREPLVWATVKGGIAVEKKPLPLSVWDETCVWRKAGIEALERDGRDYRVAFQSAHISGQKAAILADLAVAPVPMSSVSGNIIVADRKHGLPELPDYSLGLIIPEDALPPARAAADHLRACFARR